MSSNHIRSPLSTSFFSAANIEYLQGAIIASVKSETGHTIGRQNEMDLYNLMKKVYTDYVTDDTKDVAKQVSLFNKQVVSSATKTISNSIIQNLIYLRDISQNPVPPQIPRNTSTYGLKLSRY